MNKLNNYDCEQIQKSLHKHIKDTKEETLKFAQNLNNKTINEAIVFCNKVINIIDAFYEINDNNINNLSDEQEFSVFIYEKERLLEKEDILDFLSRDLLKLVYQEATTSATVNKFEKSNIKENLEVIFDEYMNINIFTIPYLKPHLKANTNKKITEKIDYQEKIEKNEKNICGKKLF